MRILPFLLVIITIAVRRTSNADGDGFQEKYLENFGCSEVGDNLIYLPNGPNCPCGYYAKHQHKKYVLRLPPELRTSPYWRDRKLQYYICVKCAICDAHKPVIQKCSPYGDTVCGSTCEQPYQDTNAGCFLLPRNQTSTSNVTAATPFSSLTFGSEASERPPHVAVSGCNIEQTHDMCFRWESFVGSAAILVCSVIAVVIIAVWKLCKERGKAQRRKTNGLPNRVETEDLSNEAEPLGGSAE